MPIRVRRALPAALAALALSAAPAHAESLRLHPRQLLAHTPTGAQPDAPATDPVLSGDGRIVRYAAYASSATDIVPGSGAFKNIFVVHRQPPFGLDGRPWVMGDTTLASRGIDGQPADGDSWGPSIDGYDYKSHGREYTVAPRCLAFVSNASNLVNGDGNGIADVFVVSLATGKVSRIASSGPASAVALDGRCFNVSYVAGGTVYTKSLRSPGHGKVRRLSGIGGASWPAVSANGRITVYERNGAIYVNRDGRNRYVAAGSHPSSDDWGRYVAFTRGGEVWQASIAGSARPHALTAQSHNRRDGQFVMNGTWPSMTTGGAFVFFVTGNWVDSNVYVKFASCPAGDAATQVAGSPHGNYAAYSCAAGALYLSYVGARD